MYRFSWWSGLGCVLAAASFLAAPGTAAEPLVVEPVSLSTRSSLAILDGVSDQFRADVAQASHTIPDNIWQAVEQAGWRVHAAPLVVDAAPWLRGVRPRGWPAGSTWDNSDAVHLPRSRLLVLAEKRRTRTGEIVDSRRVAGVLRHELGHAFDMISGGRWLFHSLTPSFTATYREDVARIDGPLRESLAYYLQNRSAGRQETFAEAFAITLGGGSDVGRAEDFRAGFPGVMRFVGSVVTDYEP